MTKELPINCEPPIRIYSYYAYGHAIISAKERIGEVAARFRTVGDESNTWISDNPCLKEDKEGCFQFVSNNPYSESLNGCIYRKIKEEDYIHLLIEYFHQHSLFK